MSETLPADISQNGKSADRPTSVAIKAARNLTTTTKTRAQIAEATPKWLLQLLPWVDAPGGAYRVNRRRMLTQEDEKLEIRWNGDHPELDPGQMYNLAMFQGVDAGLLAKLAGSFGVQRFGISEPVPYAGREFVVIARGKVELSRDGAHGERLRQGILGEGDFFGEKALLDIEETSPAVATLTPCVLMVLDGDHFRGLLDESPQLRSNFAELSAQRSTLSNGANEYGEMAFDVLSGHEGTVELPESFADYAEEPREYELDTAQTIVRIHTRIADLYDTPYDQLKEQLRIATTMLQERQEWEIVNNAEFGLLNEAPRSMRVRSRTGSPTPDDFDELLGRCWKSPAFFLAHPRAISAFGRECTRRGVPPPSLNMMGSPFLTWRGVPIVPCDKLLVDGRTRPLHGHGKTNVLLMRVGEERQGVIGLRKSGIEDEANTGVSVRFMGIDKRSVASYLVSTYFSCATLTDDAVAVLEDVEIGSYYDYPR